MWVYDMYEYIEIIYIYMYIYIAYCVLNKLYIQSTVYEYNQYVFDLGVNR